MDLNGQIVLSVAKKMGIRYDSNDKDIKAIAGMAKVFVGELCNKGMQNRCNSYIPSHHDSKETAKVQTKRKYS